MPSNALKRVVTVAIVCGAGFVLWKTLGRRFIRPLLNDNAHLEDAYDDQLAAARERLGGGLDPLLDDLSYDFHRVDLGVSFTRSGVSPDYREDACATGFDDAFALALGAKDLIKFSSAASGKAVVAIDAKLTASDHTYQLANSKQPFPGIVMTGTMTMAGKATPIVVQPAGEVEFTHYEMGGMGFLGDHGPGAYEVAGAIVGGACKEAALALIEARTPWRRPAPPPPKDPADECLVDGFHCRENADALVDAEPAKAAKLYKKACAHEDDDACVAEAEIEIARAGREADPMDGRVAAEVAVELACMQRMPRSCTELGRVKLMPLAADRATSESEIREAEVAFTRGCDLGDPDGCALAAPLLAAHDPFAKLSPKPFAVKWGQWTQHDRGQLTAWVTSAAGVPKTFGVKEFAAGDVPDGIDVPAGADHVFAVFADQRDLLGGGECVSCMPSNPSSALMAFSSMNCVCALTPVVAGRRVRSAD